MLNVGIVGGTGYTGVELMRLLSMHPEARIGAITSRAEEGVSVGDIFPSLRGHVDLTFEKPTLTTLIGCDVVFFATPHGVAMEQARELVAAGVRVIDLAADFRLKDLSQWEKWYGPEHGAQDLLEEAVYGLPEINREKIKTARIVGNPGCYATAIELGFAPLLASGLIDPASLIADAKSGASGAGRKKELSIIYSEVVGFIPCKFCWYQRYLMYPIALFLIASLFKKSLYKFGFLSLIGLFISLYHIYLQNGGGGGGSCAVDIPCNLKYVDIFGFIISYD